MSVDGHRPKKLDLRRRWIPEHPVPLVLWSRRRWRNLRLYIDPVDSNRFRVMSAVSYTPPAWAFVPCSLLAAVAAICLLPECLAVAVGLALGLCLVRR